MMRVFLAIELSSIVRERIAALQDELKARIPPGAGVRWVRPENLHLTLRFLGDVTPSVVSALVETLPEGVRGCQPFSFSLRGGGCFPNAKRPRVAWVGVDPVPDDLCRVQRAADEAVRHHGFPPEGRGFEPHLTIARFKTSKTLEKSVPPLMTALEEHDFGETRVSEIVLFESRLSDTGANYHVVERVRLNGLDGLSGTGREQLV
ncbi:MAG: RNA 2',3'-cyclic phosphodiesterase [Acidobacteriota bacterium]|nr:MAG: RNA 2',3'-cyclic phosphodiesterase [Acidobacteriota bacterium]